MNKVKITAGNYKGKILATPGEKTHPMGERERLALFNMIGNDLAGVSVLDAFAGSGALGIEALSRQALSVVFIEKSPKAAKVIRDNLKAMELSDSSDSSHTEVICQDVKNFANKKSFDMILADPPYDDFDLVGVEHLAQFLSKDGVFVLSHPGEAPELPGLKLVKTKKYARAHLSVYQR